MKNFLLKTFLVFVAGVCFISCSTIEESEAHTKDSYAPAYQDLANKVLLINNTYPSIKEQCPQQIKQRGKFWTWFARIFCTVAADVAGTISISKANSKATMATNLKQGIDASVTVWKLFDGKKKPEEGNGTLPGTTAKIASNLLSQNINTSAIPELNGYKLEDNTAYVHNKVIINLYEKFGEDLQNFTQDQIKQAIELEYSNVIKEAKLIVSGTYCEDIDTTVVEKICNLMITCEDVDDFISILKKEYPDCSQDFDILRITMEKMMSEDINDSNIDTYTNDIVKLVDSSSIPKNNINILKTTIGVSSGSCQLWTMVKK